MTIKNISNILLIACCAAVNAQNVGINTNAPTVRLHVKRNVILDDATASEAKRSILVSDATGNGTWQANAVPNTVVFGVKNVQGVNLTGGATDNSANPGPYVYSNCYITLPKGKWLVRTTMLLTNGGILAQKHAIWTNGSLSDSSTAFSVSSDIQGGNLFSGALDHNNTYGIFGGAIIINNTSASPKSYYLWARQIKYSSDLAFKSYPDDIQNFGGNWAENQFYAIPVF